MASLEFPYKISIIVSEHAYKWLATKASKWGSYEVSASMSPTDILETIANEGNIVHMVIGDFYMPSFSRKREELKRLILMSHQYKEAIINKMPEEPAKLYYVPTQATIPKKNANELINICMEVIRGHVMENCLGSFVLVDDNPLGRFVASEMLTNFKYTADSNDSATGILTEFPYITTPLEGIILRYFNVPSMCSDDTTESNKVPYLSMPSYDLLKAVKSVNPETGLKLFTFKPNNDQDIKNYMDAMFGNEFEMAGTMCSNKITRVKNPISTEKRKIRMRWSNEDCEAFEQAYWKINKATGKTPTAAEIKKEMNNTIISTTQMASHLQKFKDKINKGSSSERTNISEIDTLTSIGEVQVSSSAYAFDPCEWRSNHDASFYLGELHIID